MDNRFKFRIWSGTEMHYNDFVVTATGYVGKITEEFLGQCVFRQDDLTADNECILMQCTGLKDKNGKLIYQGDILGDIYEGLYIHYCEHCHQLQLYSQGYGCMACNGDIHWIEVAEDNKKLEVIGNIYENEDLLKCENQ